MPIHQPTHVRDITPRDREPTEGAVGNLYRRSPGGYTLRVGEVPVDLTPGACVGTWNDVTTYYVGRVQVTRVTTNGAYIRAYAEEE